MSETELKNVVRKAYADIAVRGRPCCGPDPSQRGRDAAAIGKAIGYSDEELGRAPEGSNLGLGCGNPSAIASLKEGDVVLDLGSGAGFDCFLAAAKVGESGRVIGVDMTPEMIGKAKENASKAGYSNVEFRLGDIESLPMEDGSVDVIISNCVINLAPDKGKVFREAFRVLRPGGRLAISDMLRLRELPAAIKSSLEAYVACIPGALLKEDYMATIEEAGFERIEIIDETPWAVDSVFDSAFADSIMTTTGLTQDELREVARSVVSVSVTAVKPV